eukprot:4913011-Amphidinium_carterae.1
MQAFNTSAKAFTSPAPTIHNTVTTNSVLSKHSAWYQPTTTYHANHMPQKPKTTHEHLQQLDQALFDNSLGRQAEWRQTTLDSQRPLRGILRGSRPTGLTGGCTC